ncbi:TIGR01458 family HAD-type hydrolase [Methanofollis fontis]|uniref:Haloacid dehalogenase-like hydrolase domain-containing protein 2 n=1 Tax=Methanofollis fontis TaxID=2052832 RepID=A0A483CWD4_9EURY|nr:TIGR01458 family HAD-type hydrolase [Methanofollis fontis]TAJ45881.1 TIGR01458 family HAD-type hydrolase [Methanofollis fontis]
MDEGQIRGVLLDIDGVLYVGDRAVEGGTETIAWLRDEGIPFRCVSNTTRRSRRSIAARLGDLGYDITESEIFNPPIGAIRHLQGRTAFLLTTGDVADDFLSGGITLVRNEAEAVVIGDAGDNFTYEHLNAAFRMILDGAAIIALERDRYWMGGDGLMLSAGPFVAALEYATGRQATVVGKPAPEFFLGALQEIGVDPAGALMVGDDIRTDIDGARAVDMNTALVQTGKFRQEVYEASGTRPDHLIPSIAALPDLVRRTYI